MQCKNQECEFSQVYHNPRTFLPGLKVVTTVDQRNPNNLLPTVNAELREGLVKRFVLAILPHLDSMPETMCGKILRIANQENTAKVFSFARRLEQKYYNMATSEDYYYHMLDTWTDIALKEMELMMKKPKLQGKNQGRESE